MSMAVKPQTANRLALRVSALAASVVLVVALAACGISVNKDERGGTKKVDIESPFGGVQVRTEIDAAKEIGIPVYPGARPKKESGDNHNSANVNIASSFFGLKVVAASFESDDPPEKILDFYRKELKPWGNVLECRGNEHQSIHPGGSRELTCGDDEKHKGFNIQVMGDKSTKLKVGTTDRQRVVEVKPRGSGSEFGLVYVQTRGKGESI